jgi:hypothetical protein
VKSRTLEDNTCRSDQALDVPLALGAMPERLFGDSLLDLENITAFHAFIVIQRHI